MKVPPVNYGPARKATRALPDTPPSDWPPKLETNPFIRAWIWIWYNVTFRILFVLMPGHFLLTLPLLKYLGVEGEHIKIFAQWSYAAFFIWGMYDNNFDRNLRRIGLDYNRKKLRPEELPAAVPAALARHP